MSIICGIDFSAGAQRMARLASRIAALLDQPLVLVHVVEELALVDEALASAEYEPQRASLRTLAGTLAAGRHPIACELRAGSPGFVLPQVAVEHAASLLIVAERPHSLLERWLLGSTAAQVAAHPPVPVLFMRLPERFEAWLDGHRPLRVLAAMTRDHCAPAVSGELDALRRVGPLTTVIAQVVDATAEHHRLGLAAAAAKGLHPEAQEALLRDLTKLAGAPADPAATWRIIPSQERVHGVIVRAAEQDDADLIVLGCGKAGSWGGAHWGSGVAGGVLAAARANVLCVPPAAAPRRIPALRTVLVAVDGESAEDRAVAHAYALVAAGGTVHLALVIPPPHGEGFIARAAEHHLLPGEPADRPHLHRSLLERAPAEARERAIVTRTHVLYGEDPAEAILALAARLSADALCVTAQPSSWMSSGDTGAALAARSPIPVLLVRPP